MYGRDALYADQPTLVSTFKLNECPNVVQRYNIAV